MVTTGWPLPYLSQGSLVLRLWRRPVRVGMDAGCSGFGVLVEAPTPVQVYAGLSAHTPMPAGQKLATGAPTSKTGQHFGGSHRPAEAQTRSISGGLLHQRATRTPASTLLPTQGLTGLRWPVASVAGPGPTG